MEKETVVCYKCLAICGDNDEYLTAANGKTYCQDCYDDLYVQCHSCGEEVSSDSAVRAEYDGEDYCNECYNEIYCLCESCGREILSRYAFGQGSDESTYCSDCYHELFTSCAFCGNTVEVDDTRVLYDGSDVCLDCFDEHCFACEICGDCEWVSSSIFTCDERLICESCANSGRWYSYCEECQEYVHVAGFDHDLGLCYECCVGRSQASVISHSASDEEVGLLRDEFMSGIQKTAKTKNSGNREDYRIAELINRVGLVEHPIYIYGLKDRSEYDISITPGLLSRIMGNLAFSWEDKVFMNVWGGFVPVKVAAARSRQEIGISRRLREEYFENMVEIITRITSPELATSHCNYKEG